MKKIWIRVGTLALGIGLWGLALFFWQRTEKYAGCFNGYYDTPVVTPAQVQEFLEQADRQEMLPDITVWSRQEKQLVKGSIQVGVTAEVWSVFGSMEDFFAGRLSSGSYVWQEDDEGCMVSTALAQKLFGTDKIQGNSIEIEKNSYVVRGCIESKDLFAAVLADREKELEGLYLEYANKSEPGSSARKLMWQITGREPEGFWEGNLYSALARVLAALPIWILVLVWIKRGCGKLNNISNFSLRLFGKLFTAGIVCGLIFLGLWTTLRFSGDYLPAMWSDLGFFPELIEKKQNAFLAVCQFVLCPNDASMLGNLGNTAAAVLGTVLAEGIFLGDSRERES